MDSTQVLRIFREEMRNSGDAERLPRVTRWDGARTEVVAFDLDEESVDAAIREQVEFFRGREFEWKVFSFDSPPDLLARLEAAGFAVEAREAVVVYDLATGQAAFPLERDVRRVRTLEQLAEFGRTAEAVFRKDYSFTVGELETAIREGRPGHDAYVAYHEGVPVSVGRLYTDPRSSFAGFYGGGTLPEYRGRGFYRAVIAARARDAALAGARYLQVDALPTSLPILRRLGFEHLADTWPCVWG